VLELYWPPPPPRKKAGTNILENSKFKDSLFIYINVVALPSMKSHCKNLAFATMMAIALAAVTIVTSVSIMPSANADSSLEQTFDKFSKKCDKAQDEDTQKKEIQAEHQAQRHIPFPVIAVC
jgi:hypothetical protein